MLSKAGVQGSSGSTPFSPCYGVYPKISDVLKKSFISLNDAESRANDGESHREQDQEQGFAEASVVLPDVQQAM